MKQKNNVLLFGVGSDDQAVGDATLSVGGGVVGGWEAEQCGGSAPSTPATARGGEGLAAGKGARAVPVIDGSRKLGVSLPTPSLVGRGRGGAGQGSVLQTGWLGIQSGALSGGDNSGGVGKRASRTLNAKAAEGPPEPTRGERPLKESGRTRRGPQRASRWSGGAWRLPAGRRSPTPPPSAAGGGSVGVGNGWTVGGKTS